MKYCGISLIAALAAGGATSCSVEDNVPLAPIFIRVDARDPFGARPPGPLGVALLWTGTSTIYGSSATLLAGDQNTVAVRIEFPEPLPDDLLSAELGLPENNVVVSVPRIVVFSDDDRSGDFTPWFVDEPPTDRIFAVNGQGTTSVAAITDFEAALSTLSPVDLNAFYNFTGGLHTPFLRFSGQTSTLTPSQVSNAPGPPIVSLYFDDSEIPTRDIRCLTTQPFEVDPVLEPISATGTSSSSTIVHVDDRIDVENVCGLTVPSCAPVDITTVTTTVPTDQLTPGRRVISQCRVSANLESLVTLQADLRCVECDCRWVQRETAIVVRTSSTPEGWPCGDTVLVCPSELPLFRVDEACLEEDEEEV